MDETQTGMGAGPTEEGGVATKGSLPHPPQPRALRRRANQRILAGVAGGLSDYFGVTPMGFRLAFTGCGLAAGYMVLRVYSGALYAPYVFYPYASPLKLLIKTFAGVGLFAYFALWLVVPREDRPDSAAGRMMRHFPSVVSLIGGVLLLVGGGLLGAAIGLWQVDMIWAFLLIGLGVVLFRRDAKRANGDSAKTAEAIAIGDEIEARLPAVVRAPRRPRERSGLGWVTLGAALLAFGVAAALGGAGAIHLRLVQYPAIGLLVLGVGLSIGAVLGRARWLILLGLPAIPVVLVASLVQLPLEGRFSGDIYVRAQTTEDLAPEYHSITGSVNLDLSHLDLGGQTVQIEATSAIGSVEVYVPAHAQVVVTGDSGGGSVQIGTRFAGSGWGKTFERTLTPEGRIKGVIRLHIRVGIGNIFVYRFVPPHHNKDKGNGNQNDKGNGK